MAETGVLATPKPPRERKNGEKRPMAGRGKGGLARGGGGARRGTSLAGDGCPGAQAPLLERCSGLLCPENLWRLFSALKVLFLARVFLRYPPKRPLGTAKQPKHKVYGWDILGHPGPRRRDIPDKDFMQVVFFFCWFRQGVAGMSRDLGRDVPDLEKLYARKL